MEYVGLIVVVVAIVGALLATNMGPELAGSFKTAVCEATGGDNCGGADNRADDGGNGGNGDQPAGDGGKPKSQAQIDYEKALKELQDAQKAEKDAGDKAKDAAKELAKILAEELGITDAFNCITKGDMGACTETLINILTSLIGGAVGKLAAKYGAPWKWKKAAELIGKLKKHGGDLYDGITDLIKNRKKVKDAQKKLDDAKAKVDQENKGKPDGKPDEKKPDDKPTTCPVGHSFLPGTRVLVSGGLSVPIESVRLGDEVLATDPVTGLTMLRTVTRTFTTHDDKDFTRLTTSAGTVTATDTHPFWLVDERRWADAGDIERGDLLRLPSGTTLQVTAVNRYTQRQTTHDLSVAGIHTYYVGLGTQYALVHNNDPCDHPDYDPDPEYGITDDAFNKIDDKYGVEIADGVDYNVKRIKSKDQAPPNETPEEKAQRLKNADDHIIPGTNGDPAKMAEYFASFKDKKFTHHDPRPPNPNNPSSQADVLYDEDKGVVIINNGKNIHGYKMSKADFDRLYSPGAKRS
ncbi:polymorphic toxin-type HINT domain-containing protein [Streptomyces sp. HUAS MG47]|uniref:polymorphic toxin-type HINT domain-containing protein n=1 Tax=Streptomyces solicamelliae TaxID=3231716 RepID=UPI0038780439